MSKLNKTFIGGQTLFASELNMMVSAINGAYDAIDDVETGASKFNELSGRPSYNNAAMTSNTNIPEVKTSVWDGKQDALSNASVLSEITSSKVSAWDAVAAGSYDAAGAASAVQGNTTETVKSVNDKVEGLGDAAMKAVLSGDIANSTSSNENDLVTAAQVKAFTAGITGVLKYRGVATNANLSDITNPASGDFALYGTKEYVYNGTSWQLLGDETAYDVAGAANTAKSQVVGASTDTSASNTIYGVKKYADSIVAGKNVSASGDSLVSATAASNKVTVSATSALTSAISKANSAVQSIVTGDGNGQIKVDGTNINVKGLGSAAYTDTTAYDAAGAASAVQGNTTETVKSVDDKVKTLNDIGPVYVITKNDVTVTTDSTKGVSPYSSSYGYTNITINTPADLELVEGLKLLVCCGGDLTVASAVRNVRIRIGSTGTWIPVYTTSSIAAGSSYLVNGYSRILVYRTDIRSAGAFHIITDNNTTYSPQSLGFGIGTCSTEESETAKTATLASYALTTNGFVAVKFTYAVPADATLSINNKTAKEIYYQGEAITSGIINAGDTALFVYDGSHYELLTINSKISDESGVSDFNDLTNRPSYNNVTITSNTNIPEVKTSVWDGKQNALSNASVLSGITASKVSSWDGKQNALSNASVLSGITASKVSSWDGKQDSLSNASVLSGITASKVSSWDGKQDSLANASVLSGITDSKVSSWDAVAAGSYDAAGAANTAKSQVVGASTDTSASNTIYGVKKYADSVAATAESNAKAYTDNAIGVKPGLIGTYTKTFTSTQETADTGIALTAGQSYLIVRTTSISLGAVKFFNDATVSNITKYTRLSGALEMTIYKAAATGNLKMANTFFNKQSDGIFSGEITINVYDADSPAANDMDIPVEYVVNKSNNVNTGYVSTTDIFNDLQFDSRKKTIYIDAGEYDIYTEYNNYQMPVFVGSGYVEGYHPYNVYIPENAHVIGRGCVKLIWMPNPSTQSLTLSQSYAVSTVNVHKSMTLENVEIYCKNARYAIHDDPLGDPECTGAIKRYINVKCYKYSGDASTEDPNETYGFEYAFGSGIDKEQYMEFDSCQFWDYQTPTPYAAFLLHDRQYTRQPGGGGADVEEITELTSSKIVFRNTIFMSECEYCIELMNIRYKSWNPHLHIPVSFENCYFSGKVWLDGSHGTDANGGKDKNSFDVQLVNCNNTNVVVWDTENLYPPQIYSDFDSGLNYISWSSLKALRDNGRLVPGASYRITDYTCTTTKPYTQSAGHQFDIIATAVDNGQLNERCTATRHIGDTYFANTNFEGWDIYYTIDNDTNRFEWADAVNGKGVIYRMIDEFHNDIPYDFKNIQFLRGWDSESGLPAINEVITDGTPKSVAQTTNGALLTIPCYTFSDAAVTGMTSTVDNSIDGGQLGNLIMGNVMNPVYANSSDKQELNNICFFGTINYANTFGIESCNNTFGTISAYNEFGKGFQYNTFKTGTYNYFGVGCNHNEWRGAASGNYIIANMRENIIKGKFNYNFIEEFFNGNEVNAEFSNNSIGHYCGLNKFGSHFENNNVGIQFRNNKFQKAQDNNTLISYVTYNTFEDHVQHYVFTCNDTISSNNSVSYYIVKARTGAQESNYVDIYIPLTAGNLNDITIGNDSDGNLHQGNMFDSLGDINTILDNINGEVI